MKSLSLEQDKTQTYESLTTLESKLKLAEGWKFLVAELDKRIWSSRPTTGSRGSCRTSLLNTYDRCGGAYSNFRP
jgi:hypothetical protein